MKVHQEAIRPGGGVEALAIEARGEEWRGPVDGLPAQFSCGVSTAVPAELPSLATANDVRELVQFLKKRPLGVSVSDIPQPLKKRVFYPRKLAAYEYWGIITKEGEHIELTPLGSEFARRIEPEAEIYRDLLASTPLYNAALLWLLDRRGDVVTLDEMLNFWREQIPEALEAGDNGICEGSVACFFNLCQAAELGIMTVGRRTQPARLRVLRDELSRYFSAAQPSHAGREALRATVPPRPTAVAAGAGAGARPRLEVARSRARLRVFISYRVRTVAVERVLEAIAFDGVESTIVERGQVAADDCPVSEDVLEAMRECQAGIIVISGDDYMADDAGGYSLSESVLSEIGMYYALYDRRIIIVCDGDTPLPAGFNGLARCEFDRGQFTWESGFKLLQLIKTFER